MSNCQPRIAICYACPSAATTKCHRCNAYSCVRHVDARVIRLGKSSSHSLYCPKCYEAYEQERVSSNFFTLFVVIVVAILFLALSH